jgi:hypothetical protein
MTVNGHVFVCYVFGMFPCEKYKTDLHLPIHFLTDFIIFKTIMTFGNMLMISISVRLSSHKTFD